ncbi:MAG: hypothetical protein AAFO95_02745 [Cyanobacteria bacterium J06600_6]
MAASINLDSETVQNKISLHTGQNGDLHSSYLSSIAVTLNRSRLRQPNQDSLTLTQNLNSESKSLIPQIPVAESVQAAIDRYWALGAMALTSGISLSLLWFLFQKPRDNKAALEIAALEIAASDGKLSAQETKIASESESEAAKPNAFASSTANLLTADDVASQAPLASPSPTVADIDVVQELIRDLQSQENVVATTSKNKFDVDLQISRRRKAIWELTKSGDYRSIQPLLAIMSEVSETDKSLIVEAVSQITNRSFKPINEQLFANLQDRSPQVRLNAVRDLKHLYQFVMPAIAKIASMQSDPDYQVRQTAIQTLKQLNTNPLPTFEKPVAHNLDSAEIDDLVSGKDREANLHLVAYLLEELDTEKS